jgi:serine phosphatase RsbU (regulator of sigma subunit)
MDAVTGLEDTELAAAAAKAFAGLLEATHLTRPSDLAGELAAQARPLGIDDVVLYLVDYEQTALVPLTGPGVPERPVLRVDGTLPGRAYSASTIYPADAGRPDQRRLWLPLIDGTERLGVMELTVPVAGGEVARELLAYCERYAHLAAGQIVAKGAYGDTFEQARRRRPMTVAAELQRTLLPPLTFATRGLVVAGVLEPCYTAGGDSFDYSVDGSTAQLAVLDAMGHGLGAACTAAVAVSAYRSARRQRLDLAGTYAAVHGSLTAEFGGDRFATGVLARLDLGSGELRWVNAGHPPPLLLRGGRLVKLLEARPSLPLGLVVESGPVTVAAEALEPGDRILLYTDGVTEARTPDGEFFTAERLAEFLERQAAAGLPTPETLRRLRSAILAHQGGRLQDDATALLVEWRRDAELALLPETVRP